MGPGPARGAGLSRVGTALLHSAGMVPARVAPPSDLPGRVVRDALAARPVYTGLHWIPPADDGGHFFGGHAVEVEMKLGGLFVLGFAG